MNLDQQMKALCLLVALFFIVPHHCISQESSPDTVRKNKRNELGLSILTPMIMMAGTPDLANRFTNLTYRRWNGSRHGFKLLAGAIINESNYEDQLVEIRSAAKTYSLVQERRESNLQAGLGYEFLLGGTRLQH